MEDSHSVHLYIPPSGSAPLKSTQPPATALPEQPAGSTVTNNNEADDGNALAAVFDGHGGSSVAKFSGTTLHARLIGLDAYKAGDYSAALKEVFLKTDEDLRADPSFFNDPSGCTAVVGLLTNDGRIIVANAGDSRSVLGYKGVAKAMSYDHKPTNKEETTRITSAGGFVEFGRVNGNLALSRALGDFEFKQNFSLDPEHQIVTCDPEIITHKLDGEEEFLVLACDGIWDCLSSQQVVDFTRRAIAKGHSLGKICEDMMTKCLARDSETGGIGCDNMTVVIVALLGGRSPEDWQQWVKERVDNKVGHDTPESIPDVFANLPSSSIGGITGAGFRVGGSGGLANIASLLGASGITFKPADDSDDDEEDQLQLLGEPEDRSSTSRGASQRSQADGYMDNKALDGETRPRDLTNKLAEDPESALSSNARRGRVQLLDEDGDSTMDSGDESDSTTTGTAENNTASETVHISGAANSASPIQPSFTSIGSPEIPTPSALQGLFGRQAPDQLSHSPQGDAYPAAAHVEGLMDTSESPMKM